MTKDELRARTAALRQGSAAMLTLLWPLLSDDERRAYQEAEAERERFVALLARAEKGEKDAIEDLPEAGRRLLATVGDTAD